MISDLGDNRKISTFENIAEELKKLRQLRGWSQEDLARTLGVSFATVNRWENSKTKPSRLAQEKNQTSYLYGEIVLTLAVASCSIELKRQR